MTFSRPASVLGVQGGEEEKRGERNEHTLHD